MIVANRFPLLHNEHVNDSSQFQCVLFMCRLLIVYMLVENILEVEVSIRELRRIGTLIEKFEEHEGPVRARVVSVCGRTHALQISLHTTSRKRPCTNSASERKI